MKKAILIIASFAFLVITLAAFNDRATAPGVGFKAPDLFLVSGDSVSSLHDYKGETVLVTFWSSGDAPSRIRCNEYSAIADRDNRLHHIAVNFDSNEALFGEIVKRDNLTASKQYHVDGERAELIKLNYHLDRGLHSFLINHKGVIVAVDPDVEHVNNAL